MAEQVYLRGRWQETVRRSALTLKLLTYEPTGAIADLPPVRLPGDPRGADWDGAVHDRPVARSEQFQGEAERRTVSCHGRRRYTCSAIAASNRPCGGKRRRSRRKSGSRRFAAGANGLKDEGPLLAGPERHSPTPTVLNPQRHCEARASENSAREPDPQSSG